MFDEWKEMERFPSSCAESPLRPAGGLGGFVFFMTWHYDIASLSRDHSTTTTPN